MNLDVKKTKFFDDECKHATDDKNITYKSSIRSDRPWQDATNV